MHKMTQTQKKRFRNMTDRIFRQTQSRVFFFYPKQSSIGLEDEGIEFGEEISQVQEVLYDGVIYRIIVSAGRSDKEGG